jgi:DNA-binding MarR family transcriptional regulator
MTTTAPMPAIQDVADMAGRLRIAAGRLTREATAHGDSITPSRLAALSVLDRCGPLRVGALAEKVGISAPTTSKLVDCLAERGLVVRTTDPDDHRAVHISLSPSGDAALHSVRELGVSMLAERIGGLGEADLALLAAALPVLEGLT